MRTSFERLLGFVRPRRRRIAILDDLFPHPISGFRFEEFLCYLEEMPGVSIHSTGYALPLVRETCSIDELIDRHLAANPHHAKRVFPLRPDSVPEADGYYSIFLNNIEMYLSAIERAKKPFAFTLYPGGGFQIDDEQSDGKLRRVCRSPFFRQVIVTQRITRDYLLKRHGVPKNKVVYVQGGIISRTAFVVPEHRPRFGIDKDTLDIGFVANRYTTRGEDKGYDLFVETARAVCSAGVTATYHVVGPWDANIIPLGDLSPQFIFHGYKSTEDLRELGRRLDLIISPNRPGILGKGAFDGFPTSSCAEIGLQDTAIVCTDILKLNTDFRDGVEILLVEPDVEDIVRRLLASRSATTQACADRQKRRQPSSSNLGTRDAIASEAFGACSHGQGRLRRNFARLSSLKLGIARRAHYSDIAARRQSVMQITSSSVIVSDRGIDSARRDTAAVFGKSAISAFSLK